MTSLQDCFERQHRHHGLVASGCYAVQPGGGIRRWPDSEMAVYGFISEPGTFIVEEFKLACCAAAYGKIDAKHHR